MDSDDEKRYEEIDYYARESGLPAEGEAPIVEANTGIIIGIQTRETRGSALKKHTEYLIVGEDKNGKVNVWRRFNQFHEMRIAMVKSWPGCLIPSLPSKNPLLKNEEQMNRKRQMYLDGFLKKMALRPYLYYSEQFQALLRSEEKNLSSTFQKWPAATPENIINRYKQNFHQLAGREISSTTISFIFDFSRRLDSNQEKLLTYRKISKELAMQRDRYNLYYADFFKAAKNYELTMLAEYGTADRMLYGNIQLPKLQKHEADAGALVARNPYWLLYDLIKNEERDGRAFIELLRSIEYYGDQARQYQSKIQNNLRGISDSSEGKTSIRTLTMKGTNDEIKYQLQVETEVLKREQLYTQTLRDIVTALVAFIQIEQYRQSKRRFYDNVLNLLVQNQTAFVSGMTHIWSELQEGIAEIAEVFNE